MRMFKSKYDNSKTPEERLAFWINDKGHKRCCTCQQFKPFTEFHKDKNFLNLSYTCKECACTRSKQLHHKRMKDDPLYVQAKKDSYRKSAWGLSSKEYDALLVKQDSRCAICKTATPKGGWHLDHNHVTGAIRKFLCNPCNRGLGFLQDSQELLTNAIEYLQQHTEDE